MTARRRVLIVGGGFGGLAAAKALRRAPVDVTVLDRTNHHLFQPLLYQVATAGLSPAQIATPIRTALRKQLNVRVLLGEVTRVDLDTRQVQVHDDHAHQIPYDDLIIAVGARTTWFGNDQWAHYAGGLKSLDDAVEIRRRVLLAFEEAERAADPMDRARLCTFVVVGAGATGVELAGALAELSRFVLRRDFKNIDTRDARVLLVEGGERVLSSFSQPLSEKAAEQLRSLGVELRFGQPVKAIDALSVTVGDEVIPTETVIWAAGVAACPLVSTLGHQTDRAGRVTVTADCSLPGCPNVFVIGDAARFETPLGILPGVSAVAMQQGRFVADLIDRRARGESPNATFTYDDRGTMATIGRKRAVVQTPRFQLSGYFAWLTWLLVHIFYLIGHRNRIAVLLDWFWSYMTYQRGARLITGGRLVAGPPPARDEAGPPPR